MPRQIPTIEMRLLYSHFCRLRAQPWGGVRSRGDRFPATSPHLAFLPQDAWVF